MTTTVGRRRRRLDRRRRGRDGRGRDQHRAHGRGRRDGARSSRRGRRAGLGVDLGVDARRDAGPRRPDGAGARLVELELGRNGKRRHDTAGNVTSRPADDDEQGREGSLEWSWDWTRDGVSGWTWDWNRQLKLSCASCIWIWNWSWSWTGQPASGEQGPAPTIAPLTAPGQLNVVSAQATATASSQVDADGRPGRIRRGRRNSPANSSTSPRTPARSRPRSRRDVSAVAWDGGGGQSNTVASIAGTTLAGTSPAHRAAASSRTMRHRRPVGRPAGGARPARQRERLGCAAQRAADRTGSHAAASSAAADDSRRHPGDPPRGAARRRHRSRSGPASSRWWSRRRTRRRPCSRRGTAGPGGRAVWPSGRPTPPISPLVAQVAEQTTAMDGGWVSQTAEQLAFVGQDASARAATDRQVGTGSPRRPGAGRWR